MKRADSLALIFGCLIATVTTFGVFAQTPAPQSQTNAGEDTRLREALRNAIAQSRALEDDRNRLQARVTKAEADATKYKAENIDLSSKLKDTREKRKEERELFEKLLVERDETLENWKSAYEEAATVARTKESDRLKLETELKSLTPALETARKRNAELVEIGREILLKYQDFGLAEALERNEPMFGIKKVRVESTSQDYLNKILDRKEIPAARK